MEVTRDKIPNWPHDKLTVLAEQSSVFYDLMTPELVEQVLALTPWLAWADLWTIMPPEAVKKSDSLQSESAAVGYKN